MTKEENCLTFTDTVSRSLLEYFNGKGVNVIQEFCYYAIDRLRQSAVVLKTLIPRAEETQNLEYGCAILVRSVLSDALHILNAVIISKVDDETDARKNLDDFCFSSLADSVGHLINNIRRSTNVANKEQAYEDIKYRYHKFLESQENTIGKPKVQTGTVDVRNDTLAKKIKRDEDFYKYSFIYEAFLYYSKYEHFGPVYHDFQEHGFHTQMNKIRKLIRELFPYLLTTTVGILRKENEDDDHIRRCFENLVSFHISIQEQT